MTWRRFDDGGLRGGGKWEVVHYAVCSIHVCYDRDDGSLKVMPLALTLSNVLFYDMILNTASTKASSSSKEL